jgi:hypothetical protein
MDLYPQPGLLKSQIAALTRPHCTPSGFTITYVLSEPPCIQWHLSKQAFAHRKIKSVKMANTMQLKSKLILMMNPDDM